MFTDSIEKFISKEALLMLAIRGPAMAIKSFRLSEERVEKYNEILANLRIDGETESDRFRNLIDYLYDYFSDMKHPFNEMPDFGGSSVSQRMDFLDLLMDALSQHERKLDGIARRFEKTEKAKLQLDPLKKNRSNI
jgi:hypothetical protein